MVKIRFTLVLFWFNLKAPQICVPFENHMEEYSSSQTEVWELFSHFTPESDNVSTQRFEILFAGYSHLKTELEFGLFVSGFGDSVFCHFEMSLYVHDVVFFKKIENYTIKSVIITFCR